MFNSEIRFAVPKSPEACGKCKGQMVSANGVLLCPRCEWRCRFCRQVKTVDSFPPYVFRGSKKANGVIRPRWGPCHGCQVELNRKNSQQRRIAGKTLAYERRPATKRIRLNTKFNRQFGISVDDYERMHKDQNGLCWICGKAETETTTAGQSQPNRLTVDHDHDTGKVRGLLCAKCNQGIGCLMHSPDLLKKAILYLEGTQS